MKISYKDFTKVDIRAGTVVRAESFAEARVPAIKLWVDFGPEIGLRKSSAQITENYMPEDLIDCQVAGVVNFPSKQIGNFMSEVLILGFPDANNKVVLISPNCHVPNGGRLY